MNTPARLQTVLKNQGKVTLLIASLSLVPFCNGLGQTFTVLQTLYGGNGTVGRILLDGNTLYGTTSMGGSGPNYGSVFKLDADGTGLTTLHSFSATYPNDQNVQTNADGCHPYAGLVISGGALYGTAPAGGASGCGTVFKVNTDGTGLTTLYSFSFSYGFGEGPEGALVLSGHTLYGMTYAGGSAGNGAVFKVSTNGTGFLTIYNFTANSPYPGPYTNADGGHPVAALVLSGNTLYGTAQDYGGYGYGTVFKLNVDGTGFAALHAFNNSDGATPMADLLLSSNALYGTTMQGGSWHGGTVFKINTDGSGFSSLYNFTPATSNGQGYYTNSDGRFPEGGLVLAGNTLYGTTSSGGAFGYGTIFKINSDGTGFTALYNFTGAGDGGSPVASMVLSGNTLYGTSSDSLFSLSLPPVGAPPLTLVSAGANVILTWPTNSGGFNLQSTTNLGSFITWSTNCPAPVVVNGQNTVTNPISGTQQFFRLAP